MAAASKSAAPPEDVQDQGFTRPSTLILVPFRNSALALLQSFLDHYTSSSSGSNKKTQEAQIHHYSRFVSQYSLPPGSVDKLATADPGTYPEDHVQTFSGNIDDNFRMGVKVTKRSIRLFEGFFGADLIVASPLGLRLACEKEG
jgi:U3 small nucleolar RNA-associated protein 25